MPTPKSPAHGIDMRLVRDLAATLNDTGLSEIEVENQGLRIRVAKTLGATSPAVMVAPAAPAAAAPAATTSPPVTVPEAAVPAGDVIPSPMVGTVYLQAQPGAPPFARPGEEVAAGQTLLLVEAMKTMNPIAAPRSGRIVEFLVSDGQPVEYGEPLVVIA